MGNILVTGATGQIGVELVPYLRGCYGKDRVVVAGHSKKPPADGGPVAMLDVRDASALAELVIGYDIGIIYHLAGVLSAAGEANPQLAWDVNMNGLYNVLEVARVHGCAVFFPSSIAAFGPGSPLDNTPQVTIQRPQTIYGIAKLSGELLCDYYHRHYGVDARGVRYPGLVSYQALPGGGTTDYAVEIFYAALRGEPYCCPLEAGTALDMMYMDDGLRAAVELMEASSRGLKHRNAYNITAMSFTPEILAQAIMAHIPDFIITYQVDPVRQGIADSWPNQMDDHSAREEWGWQPTYDLKATVATMLTKLSERLGISFDLREEK